MHLYDFFSFLHDKIMYESPRRKSSSQGIYIALIVSWVIILIGIWFVFFNDTSSTPVAETETTRYFIGEQVMLEGTLTMADDISQFSHLLTTNDEMLFGVKSSEVALNGYTGSVQIKWSVIAFKQQMPIIQVAEIVGAKWADGGPTSGSVWWSTTYTYIAWASLGVDLSAFPGYVFSQMGNDGELYDGTKTKLLTITPFMCTPGDSSKDCTVLKNSLVWATQLTNAAGMVFLQFPETERWFAFNWNKQGYILTAEPDVELQTYVSIFEIIDPEMFANRLDEMRVLCKDINSRLATITTNDVVIEADGSVQIGLEWSTAEKSAASCVVASSLRNPSDFTLVSYTWPTVAEWTAVSATGNELPAGSVKETDPVVSAWTTTPKPLPVGYETWTPYPSVRGWTMYVEKNVISYEGDVRTGQAGCTYKMDLAYRNNASWAAADSIIYECFPAWASALKAAWYTTVWTTTGAEFLRKDITPALQNINVYIQ